MDVTKLKSPVDKHDFISGPEKAKITLVEYGDYQCPYCGQAYPIVKKIQEKLGDDLRFVFRNFPLAEMHPHAMNAAEAALSAGEHGKFWQMHDSLYEHQNALDDKHLVQYAEELGLDTSKFKNDLLNQTYSSRIEEDFLSGVRSGVNGTPTFFINGIRYDGSFEFEPFLIVLTKACSILN
jgi:protein-disulfide isomerase